MPKAMSALFVVQLHAGDCDLTACPDDVGGGDELVAATGTKIVHPQIDGAKPREALLEIAGEKSSNSSMQEAATIMPPATSSRLAVTPPCSMLWKGLPMSFCSILMRSSTLSKS